MHIHICMHNHTHTQGKIYFQHLCHRICTLKLEHVLNQTTKYCGGTDKHFIVISENNTGVSIKTTGHICWPHITDLHKLVWCIYRQNISSIFLHLWKCTHQWTTNDDKNKQGLSTLSLLQVKEERKTATEGRKKQRREQTRRQPNWIKGISTKNM